MAFPWLFAALATGATVADHQLLNGAGRRALGDTIGDAWDAITGSEPDPANPNSFIQGGQPAGGTNGNGNDEDGGILDWVTNNMGTVGPLGGILALQMSPLPDFVKKMGSIALLVMAAINFFKGRMSNEFNSVSPDQSGRHVVMEQGFDPDDPNMVSQSGPDHMGGPDVTQPQQHEEYVATAE